MKYLEDGRVKLVFDFSEKNEEATSTIFSPKIASEANNTFRWSLRGEYGWGGYYGGTTRKADDISSWYGGLRISNRGQAILNAWYHG